MSKPLFSDKLGAVVEPLVPTEPPKPKGGRHRISDRTALSGILFVLKSGNGWKLLPRELGWCLFRRPSCMTPSYWRCCSMPFRRFASRAGDADGVISHVAPWHCPATGSCMYFAHAPLRVPSGVTPKRSPTSSPLLQ
jgi:transposase